jgi:hypothetical protein
MVQLAGFAFSNQGVVRDLAADTVALFTRNTATDTTATASAVALTQTDANGFWQFTAIAEGRYDVRITDGASIRWAKYDTEVQVERVETAVFQMRNPADTFVYDFVPAAIVANRTLNWPLLTGTGTPAILQDVIAGGQTFVGAVTFSSVITANANIAFPATQVTDAGANVLDDYEEGTFTPNLLFGGVSVGMTFTTRAGTYNKIGNRVWVSLDIILSAKGTSTGDATITGLPFIIANSAAQRGAASLHIDGPSFADMAIARGLENTGTINLNESTNAGLMTTLVDTNFSDTSQIRLSYSYQI